jgi:hypothetical protein
MAIIFTSTTSRERVEAFESFYGYCSCHGRRTALRLFAGKPNSFIIATLILGSCLLTSVLGGQWLSWLYLIGILVGHLTCTGLGAAMAAG